MRHVARRIATSLASFEGATARHLASTGSKQPAAGESTALSAKLGLPLTIECWLAETTYLVAGGQADRRPATTRVFCAGHRPVLTSSMLMRPCKTSSGTSSSRVRRPMCLLSSGAGDDADGSLQRNSTLSICRLTDRGLRG